MNVDYSQPGELQVNFDAPAPVVFNDQLPQVFESRQLVQGPKGDKGDTGILSIIVGEIPSGAINGSNATFITQFSFVPSSLEVFVNGLRQRILNDYNTSGTTTILFFVSPNAGEFIEVNYTRG